MIPNYGVRLTLETEDFRDLVATALASHLVQTSKYGYDTELEVENISENDDGDWDIHYVIHAKEREQS